MTHAEKQLEMTHAEAQLKVLKEAFEKFLGRAEECGIADDEVADLFWPFVTYILNDPVHSAERIALFNNFKAKLGMELMAHERFGVEE